MQTNQQHKKRGFIQTRIMYLQAMNPHPTTERERERERWNNDTEKHVSILLFIYELN